MPWKRLIVGISQIVTKTADAPDAEATQGSSTHHPRIGKALARREPGARGPRGVAWSRRRDDRPAHGLFGLLKTIAFAANRWCGVGSRGQSYVAEAVARPFEAAGLVLVTAGRREGRPGRPVPRGVRRAGSDGPVA
jgi:hypothetical protein